MRRLVVSSTIALVIAAMAFVAAWAVQDPILHDDTGMGRFTERQLFNALRYGLRPSETSDVTIASSTPGVGNFPTEPQYLGPFMPWAEFRHMPDDDLWSIVAYLRHVRPVGNRVAASDDVPDHWASVAAVLAPYPAPPFPTVNEVRRAR